jgi:hypothetical protein
MAVSFVQSTISPLIPSSEVRKVFWDLAWKSVLILAPIGIGVVYVGFLTPLAGSLVVLISSLAVSIFGALQKQADLYAKKMKFWAIAVGCVAGVSYVVLLTAILRLIARDCKK